MMGHHGGILNLFPWFPTLDVRRTNAIRELEKNEDAETMGVWREVKPYGSQPLLRVQGGCQGVAFSKLKA
jgi:hypothetical protein